MENQRTILGIDPGTGRLGWAIVDRQPSVVGRTPENRAANGKPQTVLVDCGLIETPAKTPLSDRLELIFNELQKIIKKYSPDEMAIEEIFFVKNVKTGISVAHARGVAMLTAKIAKMEIFEYKPNEIKLGISGYGHATKEQMAKMVKLQLKSCDVRQDDVVDAIAVGLYHLQVYKRPNALESHPELSPEKEWKHPNAPESKVLYPKLSYEIVGALYNCHNHLGGGLQERYYQSLVREELKKKGLKFDEQKKLAIRGLPSYMGRFFPDFIIGDKIVLELKVGSRVKKKDVDQVMAYLRQSGKELAIIALFRQNEVVTRRLLLGYSGVTDSGENLGK
ncbi:MAG: crossover junction endodeoxyribonuclease RuvC [Candidatus Berkelbacteria bacterium]|nr:crossover junction endodeoxyribonuclease RuvC [Candidatus Berkelbacteria bacterium]